MLYCPKHKHYRALRKPRTKEYCRGCWALWIIGRKIKDGILKVFTG